MNRGAGYGLEVPMFVCMDQKPVWIGQKSLHTNGYINLTVITSQS